MKNRPELARQITYFSHDGAETGQLLLAIPTRERLERVLRTAFDEEKLLSPHGVRSLSRWYEKNPYTIHFAGEDYRVAYVPGDSDTWLFGGNSNWRGPVWFPLNYLLIEALERYHHFYGDTFTMEFPTGSGVKMNLAEIAAELGRRLVSLFTPEGENGRPSLGGDERFAEDPHWKDLVLFHEFFHGNTGKGLGASHQTGWTALVARLIEQFPGKGTMKKR
jgi:hypothetical protein